MLGKRSLVYFTPLAIFALLAVLLYVGLGLKPSEVPSPLVDKPAPAFELPALAVAGTAGGVVSNADLRGAPWVLNVFASWCVACREEHQIIDQLAHSTDSKVIGLNYKDKETEARRWLTTFGNPYDSIIVDQTGVTGIDWGVYGVPETFVIDADGIIRYKHIGPLTESDLVDKLLPVLRRIEDV